MDQLILDRLLPHHSEVVPDEVQGRERVLEVLPMQVHFLLVSLFVMSLGLRDLRDEVT